MTTTALFAALFTALSLGFGLLGAVAWWRGGHRRIAMRAWWLLALIFGAVAWWLHAAPGRGA